MSTDSKLREVTPTNIQPPRVPSFPNGQYFYDYSDEDSDMNLVVYENEDFLFYFFVHYVQYLLQYLVYRVN
jgi:hypothetical protein